MKTKNQIMTDKVNFMTAAILGTGAKFVTLSTMTNNYVRAIQEDVTHLAKRFFAIPDSNEKLRRSLMHMAPHVAGLRGLVAEKTTQDGELTTAVASLEDR